MIQTAEISIRPSTDDDVAALTAIYADAVLHGTASWEIEPPDVAEMGRRRHSLLGAGYPYIVAVVDGCVGGYAYAGPYRPRPAYRSTVENSIYVAPDRQGLGIGAVLLRALMSDCASRGFRQMVAVIGDPEGGSKTSRALHERMGFREAGLVRSIGYKQGRWLDQLLMQCALGDGAASPPDKGPAQP
jgi:phosphinothricin acetyltransferase